MKQSVHELKIQELGIHWIDVIVWEMPILFKTLWEDAIDLNYFDDTGNLFGDWYWIAKSEEPMVGW